MNDDKPISIGVVGVGHLGNFHVQQLNELPNVQISGIFDLDSTRSKEIANQYNVGCFSDVADLLTISDAVTIVTPTPTHFNVANQALDAGCHVFIEKPITETIEHAEALLSKSELLRKLIQVGHIERFNPAFQEVSKINQSPKFIEAHRLAKFQPRGTDVPVMLDLMIHDIDLILHLVQSDISDVRAKGVKVVSDSVDMANARLEFQNGCVANLTASRISQQNMRKLRLFREDEYTTVDFMQKTVEHYTLTDEPPKNIHSNNIFEISGKRRKFIIYDKPTIDDHNALREELAHFANAIQNTTKPHVDGHSGLNALKVALMIQDIIQAN
jgi:predicted dehydrogenase